MVELLFGYPGQLQTVLLKVMVLHHKAHVLLIVAAEYVYREI